MMNEIKEPFFARIESDEQGERKQILADHINGVTSRMKAWSDGTATDELAGLVHDFGKYRLLWQEYLADPLSCKGEVAHSPTGVELIYRLSEDYLRTDKKTIGFYVAKESLMYAVAAHHGIFDIVSADGKGEFHGRIQRAHQDEVSRYTEAMQNYQKEFNIKYLKNLFAKSVKEAEELVEIILNNDSLKSASRFYFGFQTRMILSSLIDGDWSDAGSFSSEKLRQYESEHKKADWEKLLLDLENAVKEMSGESEINRLRSQISEECKRSAKKPPGIYRLNVPTGGGKTLAVMRFALAHAQEYKKGRIFYISPFISILEQNAKKYREALLPYSQSSQIDSLILEHHSNILREEKKEGDQRETEDRYNYLSSNWSPPIVLTTMVQLLNTFFSSNSQNLRRLHRLRNSVIIVDEFQSVPVRCQTLFNLAINALSQFYGTTIVLCTATQPPFEENIYDKYSSSRAVPKVEMQIHPDLTSDYSSSKGFERTLIVDKRRIEGYNQEQLAALTAKRMESEESLLVILNTRRAVDKLFHEIEQSHSDRLSNIVVRVLSNNMVPAHRLQVLSNIREDLGDKKVLCISTQLIEAGVDISFSGVIRSLAGLDSITQSAGRCNRHGEKKMGEVWIVNPTNDLENLSKLKEIKDAQNAAEPILNDFIKNPAKYNDKLIGTEAIESYFRAYFSQNVIETHYPVHLEKEGIDTTLNRLLGDHEEGVRAYQKRNRIMPEHIMLNQAFRTAGKYFRPIEDISTSLLVPWGKGKEIIAELGSAHPDIGTVKDLLELAQQYCVQVYPLQMDKVRQSGGLVDLLEGRVIALKEGYYHDRTGFNESGCTMETAQF